MIYNIKFISHKSSYKKGKFISHKFPLPGARVPLSQGTERLEIEMNQRSHLKILILDLFQRRHSSAAANRWCGRLARLVIRFVCNGGG